MNSLASVSLVALLGSAVSSSVAGQTGSAVTREAEVYAVDYLTPPGSALPETDRHVRAMERIIGDTPEVAAYSRRTGSELGLFATAQNSGDIVVRLKPRGNRELRGGSGFSGDTEAPALS